MITTLSMSSRSLKTTIRVIREGLASFRGIKNTFVSKGSPIHFDRRLNLERGPRGPSIVEKGTC